MHESINHVITNSTLYASHLIPKWTLFTHESFHAFSSLQKEKL